MANRWMLMSIPLSEKSFSRLKLRQMLLRSRNMCRFYKYEYNSSSVTINFVTASQSGIQNCWMLWQGTFITGYQTSLSTVFTVHITVTNCSCSCWVRNLRKDISQSKLSYRVPSYNNYNNFEIVFKITMR